MRIIVTGGAGFIGRELIRKLNELGYTLITIVDDNDAYYERVVLEGLAFTEFLDYRKIIEKSDFSFVKNADFVFHLGANSSTRSKLIDIYDVNYLFTVKLFLEAGTKIPVVFASSGAVYGADRRINSATTPLTAYGYTKMICEKMVNYFPEFYTNMVCLRYHNVYGSTEAHKGDMSSIVYKWISGAEHCLFYDSNVIKRDFVHVDDINKAHLMFLEYWKKFGSFPKRIYDVGTGQAVSFQKLGDAIRKHTKKKIRYVENPYTHKNYQFYTRANVADLKQTFEDLGQKFLPMHIESGVKKAYNDYICSI